MSTTTAETDASPGRFTGFTRRVAAGNLVLTATFHAVVGLGLIVPSLTAELAVLRVLIEGSVMFTSEATLLEIGPTLETLAVLAPLFGVGLLVVAAATARSVRDVRDAGYWQRSLGSTVVGLANPLAAPPALVAAILLVLVRHQFD